MLSETDNGAGVVNDTTSDQLRLSGAITYTIGLKELTKNRSSRAAIRRALAVAEAELELAVVGDRVAMLTKLNDYLEARASFEKSTGGRVQGAAAPAQGVDVKSGYLMRELALEILVLIGKDGEPLFEDWSRFRPQGARLQATTLVLR